jgi:hypothetical protein
MHKVLITALSTGSQSAGTASMPGSPAKVAASFFSNHDHHCRCSAATPKAGLSSASPQESTKVCHQPQYWSGFMRERAGEACPLCQSKYRQFVLCLAVSHAATNHTSVVLARLNFTSAPTLLGLQLEVRSSQASHPVCMECATPTRPSEPGHTAQLAGNMQV